MTDIITIDGSTYDVPIVSVTRQFEQLDKYAERTANGKLHRELIGIYVKYKVIFGKSNANPADYASLIDKLTYPTEFHSVILPTDSGTVTFTGYFAGVGDEIYKIKGSNRYAKGLGVMIIPRDPVRIPA